VWGGPRWGADGAPFAGGPAAEPDTDRVDSVGVVRTDWPAQIVQDSSTRRTSFCVIKRKRAQTDSAKEQANPWRDSMAVTNGRLRAKCGYPSYDQTVPHSPVESWGSSSSTTCWATISQSCPK
jgi:hypothetical protein